MARIIMAWELGGGLGHCVNLAPIADALATKGHQVFIVAKDLLAARTVFGKLSVQVLQAPILPKRVDGYLPAPRTYGQLLFNNGFGDPATLSGLLAGWLSIYRLVRPNMIIGEHAPTAMLAARWTDARRGLIGTGFFAPPNISPMTDLRPWQGSMPDGTHDIEANCLEHVNALLRSGKKKPLKSLAKLFSEVDYNFLTTFPELDHFPQRTGGDYYGMWSPPGGRRVEWNMNTAKRAFAYVKPARKNINWRPNRILKNLEELGVETIAYAPKGNWESTPNSCVRVFAKPVNLGVISKDCDVAILNGNAGTSTELLLRGIPQLLMPLTLEQLVFSNRVAEIGAGIATTVGQTEKIRSSLEKLLQREQYRIAAQDFATRYADYSAADKINQIVENIERAVWKKVRQKKDR